MTNYYENALKKLNALRDRNDFCILAFESSCDETAVSVTRGREVRSNIISSQIEIHRRFGGVVPEIASRNHALQIDSLTEEALRTAGVTLDDISCIAVTYGAGLLGALLVGVSYAKGLAFGTGKPLIAVNHIKGHVAANYISAPDLEPPFIALLASGGHTYILTVKSFDDMEVLGSTLDDAVGEAFDKAARVLGLPYPGGPEIERAARGGQPIYKLPRAFKGDKRLDFSFSGVKTALINTVHGMKQRGEEFSVADVACSFQTEAVGVLVDHTAAAVKRTGIKKVALAGGVGANGALREALTLRGKAEGFDVLLPPKKLCTDNAAMIGVAAYEMIRSGAAPADLSLDADPSL